MKTQTFALLVALLFVPCLASANLVTNGSFETPDIGSKFYEFYNDGSTAIEGWTVVAGDDPDVWDRRIDITQTSPGWLAASDGKLLADLSATQGFNKGLQTKAINVISGQTYTLTFDIGNFYIYRSNIGVSFSTGEWGDGTVGEKTFLNSAGPITDGTTNWKKITLTWVAKNTTSTQISFFSRDPGLPNTDSANYDENPFLDNVVLEPASTPTPTPISVDLITNGSFEIPNLGLNAFQTFNDGSTVVDGWTVVAGNDADPTDRLIALVKTQPGWVSASGMGSQFFDLAGLDGFNKGLQSVAIPVESGKTYALTFDIGNFYIYQSNVGVSFSSGEWSDGTTGEKTFGNSVGPILDGTTNWKTVNVTWVAKNTGMTKISILGRNPGLPNTNSANYDQNILLDNVSFRALP